MTNESKAITLANAIVNFGINGKGPLCGAAELARQYESDPSYRTRDEAIAALVRWESSKNFATGFLAGLGGVVVLPVAVPANLLAAYIVQARLAAAIAHLNGHDLNDDRVRTFILLSLLGDAGREVLRTVGVNVANKAAMGALKRLPGKVLIEINKKVGFRLLTKFGEKGVLNLVRVIPLAGGLVGGTIDAAACATVGRTAQASFRRAA